MFTRLQRMMHSFRHHGFGISVALMLAMWATPVKAAIPTPYGLDIPMVSMISELLREHARKQRGPVVPTLRARVIVLDPGHGGANGGAVGVANVQEKQLTLDLAYALRSAIEARHPGVVVLLTRHWDRDVSLQDRIEWANAQGASLFLSLHYNSATHDRAVGFETYYLADDVLEETLPTGSRRKQEATKSQKLAFRVIDKARARAHGATLRELTAAHKQSRALASVVQAALVKELDSVDRGVKQANFAVLRGARMPAVVIESGFLSHPTEGCVVLSDTHRANVVNALLAAIEAFDATLPKPTDKPANATAPENAATPKNVAAPDGAATPASTPRTPTDPASG